jgi:RNA polymerase sigma-70 factor (ECF subfamily)
MKVVSLNHTAARLSEEDVIAGCTEGNRECQKALYDRFASKMFSLCLRYAPDYHTAEDLLQEGFVKIYYNIYKYNGSGSFEGWMKRVFINHSIEQLRKVDKHFAADDIGNIAESTTSGNEIVGKLALDDLMKLVQALPTGYRTVFNLYALEGFSHKEIAEMLEISDGTSKSQLARAKGMLKEMLSSSR